VPCVVQPNLVRVDVEFARTRRRRCIVTSASDGGANGVETSPMIQIKKRACPASAGCAPSCWNVPRLLVRTPSLVDGSITVTRQRQRRRDGYSQFRVSTPCRSLMHFLDGPGVLFRSTCAISGQQGPAGGHCLDSWRGLLTSPVSCVSHRYGRGVLDRGVKKGSSWQQFTYVAVPCQGTR
jgi:hypothetical protein